MTPQKSEIVVYQPNETLRLEVRLQGESIWLPQQRIADLFGVQKAAISKHLKNIFASGELVESATVSKMETVQVEGSRRVTRQIDLYNLDNWVGVETLDLLAKKRKGVSVTVVTSEHKDRWGKPRPTLAETDIAKFNAQYPSLMVRYSEKFHDRFLILDDEEIYLIGASLKDLGKKCFAFTKLDAGEIAGLNARL